MLFETAIHSIRTKVNTCHVSHVSLRSNTFLYRLQWKASLIWYNDGCYHCSNTGRTLGRCAATQETRESGFSVATHRPLVWNSLPPLLRLRFSLSISQSSEDIFVQNDISLLTFFYCVMCRCSCYFHTFNCKLQCT